MDSKLYIPIIIMCLLVGGAMAWIMVRFLKYLAALEEARWGKTSLDREKMRRGWQPSRKRRHHEEEEAGHAEEKKR